MAKITIIQPDGTMTITERDASERPTLAELQEAVGGYIEGVDAYLPEGTVAYANEEGLLMGLAPNPKGAAAVQWPGLIVGPVIICEGFKSDEEDEEDYVPLTPEQLHKLRPGDEVFWNDPDGGACSRVYKIRTIEIHEEMVCITDEDGSDLECFPHELS